MRAESRAGLLRRVAELESRLQEADEILTALRKGEVDAVVVSAPDGDQVYTLRGADEAYRLLVEQMAEGAVTVTADGVVLFANEQFAAMLGLPLERVMGSPLHEYVTPEDAERLSVLLRSAASGTARREIRLRGAGGSVISALLSGSSLRFPDVAYVCLVVTDVTALRKSEEALRHGRKQLERLTKALLSAEENERRRIARNLHDGVNQSLAATILDLDRLAEGLPSSPERIRKRLRSSSALLAQVADAVRDLAYELRPAVLEHFGLKTALKAECEEFSKRLGIPVRFTARGLLPRVLPPDVSTNLYRVAQECLRNVARHGGAKRARVALVGGREEIRLVIQDDGTGFAREAARTRGLGVLLMEERMRLLGGSLTVESHPGKGTRVKAVMPISVR